MSHSLPHLTLTTSTSFCCCDFPHRVQVCCATIYLPLERFTTGWRFHESPLLNSGWNCTAGGREATWWHTAALWRRPLWKTSSSRSLRPRVQACEREFWVWWKKSSSLAIPCDLERIQVEIQDGKDALAITLRDLHACRQSELHEHRGLETRHPYAAVDMEPCPWEALTRAFCAVIRILHPYAPEFRALRHAVAVTAVYGGCWKNLAHFLRHWVRLFRLLRGLSF